MLLTCFATVKGLKINVSKSEMVPVGEVNNLHELVEVFGCKIGVLPMTYLGIAFGSLLQVVLYMESDFGEVGKTLG